jgi:hypothetical protein
VKIPYSTKPELRPVALRWLLVAIVVLTSLIFTGNVDFRVYWYGAVGFFNGSKPAYGPASGIGFPMHYRYPPVTYLLLWPLSWMSLYWAGFVWKVGGWIAAAAATKLAIHTMGLRFTRTAVLATGAFMVAYIFLALRSGNVQTYIIAMILAALALSESHRPAAACLMALAITFKIWPLFFLPWFLRPQRRLVLVWLIPAMGLLWLAPLLVWNLPFYADLIHQWYQSELQSASTNSEIWYFPGQSLRGVLLRYFTPLAPWIKGFPDIHILSLSPAVVVSIWKGIAVASYLAACVAMLRSDPRRRWVWDGLSFVLFSVLQPFCLKSSLISLGPAALTAASLYSVATRVNSNSHDVLARRLFLAACTLSF